MKAALNFEPMLLWCRPHPSLQAKSNCLNSPCNGDVLTLLKRRIYHQTMTKNRSPLSLRSRLSGLPSRPVETRGALRRSLENASLWPLGPGNLVSCLASLSHAENESGETRIQFWFHTYVTYYDTGTINVIISAGAITV